MLPKADNSWTVFEAAHLLNRAGFGGSPEAIRAFHTLGREKAVDSLLEPAEPIDAIPAPEWASQSEAAVELRMLRQERREAQQALKGLSPEEMEKQKRQMRRNLQQQYRQRGREAQGWWFRKMLATDAPLREKMTLFWHDHFATSLQKVKQPALMVRQNELFRRSAFGSFRDLTQEILMDPAMMRYLDTQSSKKGKPNENFAREVMELFTLGEGNYTEQDVREAARAFTGYQLGPAGGVVHNKKQWDSGDKTIFGKTGPFTGTDVINRIFEKKEPASFMSRKLWEFFVHESPSPAAISSLADTLARADYRTGPLLREIFLSREFYSEAAMRSQIKCPVQYLLGMLKQLEITEPPPAFALQAEEQLGQVLFLPPNVAGWDWGKAWINTNTLLTRYNLAGFLTQGADQGQKMLVSADNKNMQPGRAAKKAARTWEGPDYEQIAPRPLRENPDELVDSLVFRLFQGPLPEKARKSFVEYAVAKKGAIFTNKETAELCHLMMSTPYYQLT